MSKLDDLLGSGNVEKAMQIAFSLLSATDIRTDSVSNNSLGIKKKIWAT